MVEQKEKELNESYDEHASARIRECTIFAVLKFGWHPKYRLDVSTVADGQPILQRCDGGKGWRCLLHQCFANPQVDPYRCGGCADMVKLSAA